MRLKSKTVLLLLPMLLLCVWHAGAIGHKKVKPEDLPKTRLRIEVRGGDDNRPIADASVYLRFQENPREQKGKMLELNLKTSSEGVALVPEIPQGHILIQIIATGWKTYGE